MNTKDAIKFLNSKGYRVYPSDGKWIVWSPGGKNVDSRDRYTDRGLIHYARSAKFHGPHGHSKDTTRGICGPVWHRCPCCIRGNFKELKHRTARNNRIQGKKDIRKFVTEEID